MKLTVGRCPETGAPLASQSTISRLENAPSRTEAARLAVALLDHFGETEKPGSMEILDIDRHVLRGAWRPATGVLERTSRPAWLCIDTHLSRGELQAGGGHPAPGAHAERNRGPNALKRDQLLTSKSTVAWPTMP